MRGDQVRAIAVAKAPRQQSQITNHEKHSRASTTPKNMKNLTFLLCCSVLLHSNGSAVAKPAPHGITTTTTTVARTPAVLTAPSYTVAITPVVTAHSHQVVAHNYNGLYVPAGYVPAAYPYSYSYPATTYRYGYGYYPAYGYTYGYGTAVPTTALWR